MYTCTTSYIYTTSYTCTTLYTCIMSYICTTSYTCTTSYICTTSYACTTSYTLLYRLLKMSLLKHIVTSHGSMSVIGYACCIAVRYPNPQFCICYSYNVSSLSFSFLPPAIPDVPGGVLTPPLLPLSGPPGRDPIQRCCHPNRLHLNHGYIQSDLWSRGRRHKPH